MAGVDEAEIEREFRLEHGDGSDHGALNKGNSGEDILLMKHAFRNEKGSPEILLYEENLVFTVKELVANQQEYVDESHETVDDSFAASLHQCELERIKYLLLEYHRMRLTKIQRHTLHILSDDELRSRLSRNEEEFAKAYLEISVKHLKRSALSKFPRIFQKLTDPSMVSRPAVEKFVFCKVEEEIGEVDLENTSEITANLEEGRIYALQYEHVRNFVATGKVLLL